MLNLSDSSLRTDHLYVPHEIADIAQRSGVYRMKGLFAHALPALKWCLSVSISTPLTPFS